MTPFKLASIIALSVIQLASGLVTPQAQQIRSVANPDLTARSTLTLEVIPGPGMPSLESVGLSNDMILDSYHANSSTKRAAVEARSALFVNECVYGCDQGSDVGLYACNVYLIQLPAGTVCGGVTENGITFCSANYDGITTYVSGVAGAVGTQASLCTDVAIGAEWLYGCETCSSSNCPVGGEAAANGNGNLIVVVTGSQGGACD